MQNLGVITNTGTYSQVIAAGKDAAYSVNGTSYTSASNAITLVDSAGKSQATVTLTGIGTSNVSNTVTHAVLQNIGVLNSSGQFANTMKNAQDARYSINGTMYQSNTNHVTLAGHASIVLTGAGVTVVSNQHANSIMKNIGILSSSGQYANVLSSGQDAHYTVNGTNWTSTDNTVTLRDANGLNQATVTLTGIGSSIVSNTISKGVMEDIGILDGSGQYSNLIKAAQDAKYSVNGVNYTDSGNSVTLRDASGMALAKVTLAGAGFSTVSNQITQSILSQLGILDSQGKFRNLKQNGQDAVYKVDGQNYSSASNSVDLYANGTLLATVQMLKEGFAVISNTLQQNGNQPAWPADFSIQFGSDSGGAFRIQMVNLSAEALGISNLHLNDDNVLEILDQANEKLSSARSKLGSYENALDRQYNHLMESAFDLETAVSRIVDVDMAKEAMNLIKSKLILTILPNVISKKIESDRQYIVSLLHTPPAAPSVRPELQNAEKKTSELNSSLWPQM
jgi:flagellin